MEMQSETNHSFLAYGNAGQNQPWWGAGQTYSSLVDLGENSVKPTMVGWFRKMVCEPIMVCWAKTIIVCNL